MTTTRRGFLTGAAAVLGVLGCHPKCPTPTLPPSAPPPRGHPAPRAGGSHLVLLGTGGGPRILANGRAKPSTAVVVNGEVHIVDCGSGVAQQLVAAGLTLSALRTVFITHHHSDHNLDYGNLIYSAWVAGLKTQIDTYGPPPLKAMTEAYWALDRFDVETRISDEGRPDPRDLVVAHEFAENGLVMKSDHLRVMTTRVFHPPLEHAYAYRFDAKDRSFVISGDTGYSEALVTLAANADVLVHEAMHLGGVESMLKRVPNAPSLRVNLLRHHTSTEDVGRVAAAARVRKLVLTHLVPPDDRAITEEMWLAGVRKHYDGDVVLGRDLLEV